MTVLEEREWALRLRWPELAPFIETRGYGILAQALLFVLTALGIGAFWALTREPLLTAVLSIALAEILMLWRKWFFTGVEAALWLGGVVALLEKAGDVDRGAMFLLAALAFAAAGARVRQPLLGAVAAYLLTAAIESWFDLGTVAALFLAMMAVVALLRTWRRPTSEWLFVALAITMPLAAWAHADAAWLGWTVALCGLVAAIAFAAAIWKRHHGLFAAAGVSAVAAVFKLYELAGGRAEVWLALAGLMLLGIAYGVSRALRGRSRGFVLTPVDAGEIAEAVQVAATIPAMPSTGNPPDQRSGDGGGFGGGGATGGF